MRKGGTVRFLKRMLAACAVLFAVGLTLGPAAYAAAPDDVAALSVSEAGSEFVIAPVYWSMLTGLAIPVVIALLTKETLPTKWKAVLGIVAAALSSVVIRATTVDGSGVLDQALFVDTLLVFGPQVLSYVGFWKPVLDVNAKVAPNFGVG